MSTSGPGPEGPGPDASAAVEAARRRLYRPGGPGQEALAEYERLSAIAASESSGSSGLPSTPAGSADEPVEPAPRGGRTRVMAAVGGVAALLLIVPTVASTRPSLPQQVDVPPLAGTTLLAYGRALDPATGPGSVSYQPEGYTVFQPRGRTVAIALRCVGEGTVRISAGPRFDFRCTDHERIGVQRDHGPRSSPFIVMGTTVGDVVWSARIVLLDPPQTAGAIPSFQDSCASCAVVGGTD